MSHDAARIVSLFERLTTHALVGIVGAVILWDAATLTGASAIFPRAVGGILIVLAAITAVLAPRAKIPTTDEAPLAKGISALMVLFLYIQSAGYFGFLSSSLWFVPALALLGGDRKPGRIAILTIGFSIIVFLVFVVLFKQPLPPELIFGEI